MNENKTQISGSQPNPAEIGIPSVAGKKIISGKKQKLGLDGGVSRAYADLHCCRFLSEAFSEKRAA